MSVELALLDFFTFEIGRAHRALERHRPDLHGRCTACSTQLALAAWPCRICVAAARACDLNAQPPEPLTDRLFQAAIEHNATSRTVPMRAVSRTPPLSPAHPRPVGTAETRRK